MILTEILAGAVLGAPLALNSVSFILFSRLIVLTNRSHREENICAGMVVWCCECRVDVGDAFVAV